jgi:hypothetical protein
LVPALVNEYQKIYFSYLMTQMKDKYFHLINGKLFTLLPSTKIVEFIGNSGLRSMAQ